jgi:phosphoribosylanthranilate isomerase
MRKFNSLLPLIKICCISSIKEASMAIESGAHALGLVSEMPSGPGVTSEKEIAKIAEIIPPGITSVLLTS